MNDHFPVNRRGRHQRGYYGVRRAQVRGRGTNPFIVGGFLLLAIYAVTHPENMPDGVHSAAGAYRGLGRENSPPAGASYLNCDHARSAGVAPLYRGEAGYREEMDGDGDGVACEPYR